MTALVQHPLATGTEVHTPFRWTPADAATRTAINVGTPNADDLYNLARQADDNSVWIAIATGTGASKWAFLGVDLQLTISPSQITGNQNDYNPTGFNTASVVRLDVDATVRTITGFVAATSVLQKVLVNISANTLLIAHQSASSAAANRVICPNSKDFRLMPGEACRLQYDATTTRWRLLPFEFGTSRRVIQDGSDAAVTALVNRILRMPTLTAARTVTMPASPLDGDWVRVVVTNASDFNVTVDGNGVNIDDGFEAAASTYVIANTGASLEFVYLATPNVWRIL